MYACRNCATYPSVSTGIEEVDIGVQRPQSPRQPVFFDNQSSQFRRDEARHSPFHVVVLGGYVLQLGPKYQQAEVKSEPCNGEVVGREIEVYR